MPNWELDYIDSERRFNSVWTLDMNDLMDRKEFSNRMNSINKAAYDNRYFAKWMTYIVIIIATVPMGAGLVMLIMTLPWRQTQQSKFAGSIILLIVGIAIIGIYFFLYLRSRNRFERAVISHLNDLNELDNPRVNWILEGTTIKQKGKIEIGHEKRYKLIVQTAR
jgi:hypothetical protein